MNNYPIETVIPGLVMDLRAHIALELLRTNGILMSHSDGSNDFAGRAVYSPMSPVSLVNRAFDIAEHFVLTVEKRGYFTEVKK